MSKLISKSLGHVIARKNNCSRKIPYITVYLWKPMPILDNYDDKQIDYPVEYDAEHKLSQKKHSQMYDFLDVTVISYRTSKSFRAIEYVYDL